MDFISNIPGSHKKDINKLIETSDEISIAVAFLKQSGLNELLPSIKKAVAANKKINIIAGRHYALTEPGALNGLYKLFKDKVHCQLRLAYARDKNDPVFHPKVYVFKNGNEVTIVCGSANMTNGGLESNFECSLMLSCKTSDKVWNDVQKFFKIIFSDTHSEEANQLSIGQYESFYNEQKEKNKKIKAVPVRKKKQIDFNYKNLLAHYKRYKAKGGMNWLQEKEHNYKQARLVLDKIAGSTQLTENKFSELLDSLVSKAGVKGYWHSGSLFRNRRSVYKHHKQFQKLVQYIKDHKNDKPSVVFEHSLQYVKGIYGAGVNYVTEIMMTYNPKIYANLNNNPITVLRKEGGVYMKASPTSYSGYDYENYCELVKEINSKLELKNMLEADSFFNEIYWEIKAKK